MLLGASIFKVKVKRLRDELGCKGWFGISDHKRLTRCSNDDCSNIKYQSLEHSKNLNLRFNVLLYYEKETFVRKSTSLIRKINVYPSPQESAEQRALCFVIYMLYFYLYLFEINIFKAKQT